ncbi:hypothetical protein FOZ62_011760, partial [Perkinsus olseni]
MFDSPRLLLPPIPREPRVRHYRGPGLLPHSADAVDLLTEIDAVKELEDSPLPSRASTDQRRGSSSTGNPRSSKGKDAPRSPVGRQNLNVLRHLVDRLQRAADEDKAYRRFSPSARSSSKLRFFTALAALDKFITERSEEGAHIRTLVSELMPTLEGETFRLQLLNERTVKRLPMDEVSGAWPSTIGVTISALSAVEQIKRRQLEEQVEERYAARQ